MTSRRSDVQLEAGIVTGQGAALVAFYAEALLFELVERHEFAVGTVHRLRRDRAYLKIFSPVTPAEHIDADPWHAVAGHRYIALRVDDVDAETRRVVAAGGEVLIAPTDHRPGARMALVTDLEGNVIELLSDSGG